MFFFFLIQSVEEKDFEKTQTQGEDPIKGIKEGLNEAKDNAIPAFQALLDVAKQVYNDVSEKAEPYVEKIVEIAKETATKAKDYGNQIKAKFIERKNEYDAKKEKNNDL